MSARRAPQDVVRGAVELCADCDTCRDLIERECAYFPELYRLHDEQARSGFPIPEVALRTLVERCTYCGLCPCPNIPADLMDAKAGYIERAGISPAVRFLTNVSRLARLCGTFPRVLEAVQSSNIVGRLVRKLGRVHATRRFPTFPTEDFFGWAATAGLTRRTGGIRNVAYFTGCTTGYLFPEVGRAFVQVLQRNGVAVHVPPQQCCGMPYLVEGDRPNAIEMARANVAHLLDAVRAGDDIVCSCPTCGFFLKTLLTEKAHYSDAYQRSVNRREDELEVPASGNGDHTVRSTWTHGGFLADDGYFSSVDAMARIGVGERVRDAGEYLARLHLAGQLDTRFARVPERIVYFAPCHQRKQKVGRPYLDLLRLVPGLTIDPVGEGDCCGMGGNFGFKVGFNDTSLAIGRPVFDAIRSAAPHAIVTDCMSCRLQFRHALDYPVHHPIEILARAYDAADAQRT